MTHTDTSPAITVLQAVQIFARRLSDRYPVQQIILFGSRARGDHRADSDADVAVVLRGNRGDFLDTKLEMVGIAYDVLLDTEIYIQPYPIWESEWNDPQTHSNPRLLHNIQREGIPVALP
jgi:antitoxin ChpS